MSIPKPEYLQTLNEPAVHLHVMHGQRVTASWLLMCRWCTQNSLTWTMHVYIHTYTHTSIQKMNPYSEPHTKYNVLGKRIQLQVNNLSFSAFLSFFPHVFSTPVAVVGLESTFYQVLEDVSVVEVCIIVYRPLVYKPLVYCPNDHIPCPINFVFDVTISSSTSDDYSSADGNEGYGSAGE